MARDNQDNASADEQPVVQDHPDVVQNDGSVVPNSPNTGENKGDSWTQIAPLGTPHSPPADPQFTAPKVDEEDVK
jgi:hypothetical protein